MITGRVVDADTGQPLPGATILVDGQAVGVADNLGNFSTSVDGLRVSASYVGYQQVDLPLDVVESSGTIAISKKDSTLSPVTIVAKIKKNPLPFALAAGGLLLLLTSQKKGGKKVGKIDTTTILLIAGAGAAVYLLTRPKAQNVAQLPYYQQQQLLQQQQPAYVQQQPNSTSAIISAAGGAASSILNAISNF